MLSSTFFNEPMKLPSNEMHTYTVTLVPKGGGTPITTRIQANSDMEARRIAVAQYSGYEVRAINIVH